MEQFYRLLSDFTSESTEGEDNKRNLFKMLKKIASQSRFFYPAKISVKTEVK